MSGKFSLFALLEFGIALVKKLLKQNTRNFCLLFAIAIGLTLVISACSPNNNPGTVQTSNSNSTSSQTNNNTVIRIGYQKSATILYSLKAKGDLEKAIHATGGSVTWTEFPAGPPMLEALNVGSIDFGYTGESPPIFAQAAGTPLVYVASEPSLPKAEAIIVHQDSPIKTLADLKGKRVAFAKGSNVNYLVVKSLEKAGLKYTDIKPTFLTPADARGAFEGRNIDAWGIWDPYLAAAEQATKARILTNAIGLAPNRGYYLAAKSFVEKNPQALKTILAEVNKVSSWAKNNPAGVAKLLSPVLRIDESVLETAERRHDYGAIPLTEEIIKDQQEIADTFYQIKLLPKQINVKDIVWQSNK